MAIAVRTVPPVVPRDFLMTPVQLFGMALSAVPSQLADFVAAAIVRVATGDLTRYGLNDLLAIPGMLDGEGLPRSGAAVNAPSGLHFVGFVKTHRDLLLEIERASLRLARALSR